MNSIFHWVILNPLPPKNILCLCLLINVVLNIFQKGFHPLNPLLLFCLDTKKKSKNIFHEYCCFWHYPSKLGYCPRLSQLTLGYAALCTRNLQIFNRLDYKTLFTQAFCHISVPHVIKCWKSSKLKV